MQIVRFAIQAPCDIQFNLSIMLRVPDWPPIYVCICLHFFCTIPTHTVLPYSNTFSIDWLHIWCSIYKYIETVELQKEVGMAMPKSTQTRMITNTIGIPAAKMEMTLELLYQPLKQLSSL